MKKYYYGRLNTVRIKELKISADNEVIATLEKAVLSKRAMYYSTYTDKIVHFEDDEELLSTKEATARLLFLAQSRKAKVNTSLLCYDEEDLERIPLSMKEQNDLENIKRLIKRTSERKEKNRKN